MIEEWVTKNEKPKIKDTEFDCFFRDKDNISIFIELIVNPKKHMIEL